MADGAVVGVGGLADLVAWAVQVVEMGLEAAYTARRQSRSRIRARRGYSQPETYDRLQMRPRTLMQSGRCSRNSQIGRSSIS